MARKKHTVSKTIGGAAAGAAGAAVAPLTYHQLATTHHIAHGDDVMAEHHLAKWGRAMDTQDSTENLEYAIRYLQRKK